MATKNKDAVEFVKRWIDKGDEKQHSQLFWTDLLSNVLHSTVNNETVKFEYRVQLGHQSYIDVYLPDSRVIIEQKGSDIDLFKAAKQSDGTELTPFEQAKRYNVELPFSQKARWIVTCNFKTFLIYDMDQDLKGKEPVRIELEELPERINELQFLATFKNDKIIVEQELSIKAGDLIGKLYDGLIKQYKDPKADNTLKSLNKLCVRLVFCLYAEDAGLFDRHDCHIFGNYIKNTEAKNIRRALIDLFEVLNQKEDERDPYLDEELAKFPYVNGNLFKVVDPHTEEIPNFTDELKELLVTECSESFDWANISPTIFGAVFESTLNPETRRSGGMHYTSIQNIHKVIDPLFLNELKAEFEQIKQYKTDKKISQECDAFQNKLATLKFLDPACGSGNFLTETYICLRKLENEVILFRSKGMSSLSLEELNPVKVSIHQFYGIEINDFACAVATTALWIAESQMLHETEEIIHRDIDFLPLKSNSNIVEGNALRMDWNDVIHSSELNYIMGNPPFVGARLMNTEQKEDVDELFNGLKGNGNLDYVSCWYKKSSHYIKNTDVECALVSTNSICQGMQTSLLWKSLIEDGIKINFAHTTFVWDSEASIKAHVHCVIVGFSYQERQTKTIFSTQHQRIVANINPYLIDAETCFIEDRKKAICKVPPMVFGSMPNDGGNLTLSEDEKNDLIRKDSSNSDFIRPFLGAEEFINNKKRYCLWLVDQDPSKCPEIMTRIKKVRDLRLSSKRAATQKLAKTPALFGEIRQPDTDYLIFPRHSSENRKYIPIGFISPYVIAGDSCTIVPNATLYHFGILTSSVHMAWMRAVAGRIKSDYRYSANIVYNNFIWSDATDEQREIISKTSNNILTIREKYLQKGKSLADMYGENLELLYTDLLEAHKANDKAVLALYGFKADATEEEIVAKLMQMYAEKVKESL
ncbi:MAG: N-6 DNA methylase [Succinatimonas sp.]|nr:N-6 DNA methylase [Succinatimonas sp.]